MSGLDIPDTADEPIIQDDRIQDSQAEETLEETAPSTEEVTTTPEISQEAQKIIAEKAFSAREAKREAEETRRQLEELKKQYQPQAPSIPDVPDRWEFDSDADFQNAIKARDAEVRKAIAYESEQSLIQNQQLQEQQAARQKSEAELRTKVEAYAKNANALGISSDDLQVAGNMVSAYGIDERASLAIINDKDGALVTKYLSANPQAIDQLNSAFAQLNMGNPLAAGEVFTAIRAKASALKPKQSNAPEPAEILTGGAPPPEENPWGAKFE